MTPDRIERHGSRVWQHGTLNNRVYVMCIGDDPHLTATGARDLARQHGYGKVFAKVPAAAAAPFLELDYTQEAAIPAYYANEDTCCFMSLFLDPERATVERETIDLVMEATTTASGQQAERERPHLPPIRLCTEDDAPAMAKLYGETFGTYPFPIEDPEYIVASMRSNVSYSGIWSHDKPIALSAAECDRTNGAVEMTDFAVAPSARGDGIAAALLAHMEQEMRAAGFRTAFTIARATSYGMNITFARRGYAHDGLLVNNTSICGRIESMNVWHKSFVQESKLPS